MKKIISSFIVSALICSSLAALSACNTVQGVGEDFKAAGQSIKETSEDVKRKIRN